MSNCQWNWNRWLRKWAFVSDYARIEALYKYGGWYLDTDIEILKPLSPFEGKRLVMGTDRGGARRH